MTDLNIMAIREWAAKKAAMFDRKWNERAHQYSAYVNRERYRMVIELCDKALEAKK